MPKPQKKTDLEKSETKKGVERIDIPAGELGSENFVLDPEFDAHIFHVFDALSGKRLKGHSKPFAKVLENEENATAKITLSAPATIGLAVLYRIKPEEFDEDKPEDQPEVTPEPPVL